MGYEVDFSIGSSEQIATALADRLKRIRLSRNLTQADLAREAGVSINTIGRLEAGLGISADTLIRVLIALGIQHRLEGLLPDPTVRPVERIALGGRQRERARAPARPVEDGAWVWGDAEGDDDD